MLELIKQQLGSNGEKGWPVAVKDRISYPSSKECNVTDANIAVTFLWTMRDAVLPRLEKRNLALATNFYTPSGLAGMVRNILANPYIRYIILLGEEYSSKNAAKEGSSADLTSANAIRAFFSKGINAERKVAGFETAVHFDANIPAELIKRIVSNVELIDLNRKMPNASMDEKIAEANKLIRILAKKGPFLEKPYTFPYEKSRESFPYEGGPIVVHGSTIPDSWIKMIHNIYRYGRKNLMNANTDRWVKEINNMVVVIHDPQNMDLSLNPFLVPLTKEKIEAYQKEILSPILPEGKAYTYGNKLRAYLFSSPEKIKELLTTTKYKDFEFGQGPHIEKNVIYNKDYCEINQVADIIDVLRRDPYSKACVAISWHPADELMRKHKSSPCLVMIQPIIQDEKLNLTVYFRSHDMTQGWPENAYGMAAIQKEIAKTVNSEPGIITIISCSAQIYNNYYAQVEEMLRKYHKLDDRYYDPRGNFIISVAAKKIIVKHVHPETGEELDSIEGANAKELEKQLSLKAWHLIMPHSLYLGREIAMAEQAIRLGKQYEQD